MNTFNTFQSLLTNVIAEANAVINSHTTVYRESVYAYLEEGTQNTSTQDKTYRVGDNAAITVIHK